MNRIVLFAGVIAATTSLSSCSWYMRQTNELATHMPTYEGWFGDGEKPATTVLQQNSSDHNLQINQVPRERRMPLSGNPAQSQYPHSAPQQSYGYTQPQGYPPFPPTGGGQQLPNAGSFAPPSGFSESDVPSANDVPPPPPGFGNDQSQQGQQGNGPDPMAGLKNLQMQQQQGVQQPLVPFTEPVLENFSETITEEAPKERGAFGFFDNIGDVVSGWFESEPKKEYPNLASMPEVPQYNAKMADAEEAQQELEADKQAAQQQQKAITDWSDLAEENAPSEPVTALSSITSPTGNEVVVPRDLPAEETVMPEPKVDAEKAPETVVIMQKPQAMPEPQPMPEEENRVVQEETEQKIEPEDPIAEKEPASAAPVVIQEEQPRTETKAEFLRKPEPFGDIKLLPRNRYSYRQ
jgi:hypothetical protein